jgi:hypothetical protein
MEKWQNIQEYDGLYQVSTEGRIKRVRTESKDNRGRTRIKQEVLLKPYKNNMGRDLVRLSKNGITKTFLTYRLVAQTFISNPHNKKTVNHIDGDHTNNSVENLEWATYAENIKHAWDNNLR